MKKKMRKFLLVLSAVLLLASMTVGVTLAYLTDTDAVVNTFSVGKVYISMDEADVDDEGKALPEADRVQQNEYHLIPGGVYDKDPTVYVEADSEPCWLFVKVENGIEAIEDDAPYTNAEGEAAEGLIAEQIEAFGWMKLSDGVYYRKHETKSDAITPYVVFKNFKISGENVINGTPLPSPSPSPSTSPAGEYIGEYEDSEITVKAFAIQLAGFDTAAAAWTEVSKLDP